MASGVLRYLWATLTQGSADAFVQAQVSTGLFNVSGIAYALREILIEWTNGLNIMNATYQLAVTRKSFAAMPALTERSLIYTQQRMNVMTTSGAVHVERTQRIKYDESDAPLIVEDPIYLQADSASSSVANVITVRLGLVQQKISDVDRLQLIANSLA